MAYNAAQYMTGSMPVAAQGAEARLAFVRKVYGLFAATLAVAVACVAFTINNRDLMIWSLQNHMVLWIGLIAGGFLMHFVRHVPVLNVVSLLGFGGVIGMFASPYLYAVAAKDSALITQALALTSTVFVSLTAYVFITRRDFSWMGGMLFCGFLILLVGMLLMMFFGASNAIYTVYLIFGTLLFTGYILYDTSEILHRLPENEYIHGAMALFLDFYNLFMFILQLLNNRD